MQDKAFIKIDCLRIFLDKDSGNIATVSSKDLMYDRSKHQEIVLPESEKGELLFDFGERKFILKNDTFDPEIVDELENYFKENGVAYATESEES